MGRDRVKTDSLLWVCCCCGGLPILGLIQGMVTVLPVTIGVTLCNTIIAIALLPHDVYFTYYCILRTSIIGPNLKVMAFLLLPIPLVFWPFGVFIGSLLAGLVYGLFGPMVYIFDADYNLFVGGIIATIEGSIKLVKRFFRYNWQEYFTYLEDFRSQELPEAGMPFDISILQIIVGLFVAFLGIPIIGFPVALLAICKFVPIVARGYYYLWKYYLKAECAWIFVLFFVFVLANILLPVVAILALALVVVAGFVAGTYAAWAAYKIGFIGGFRWMREAIKKFDEFTNELAFDYNESCFGPVDSDILRLTLYKAADIW